MFNNIDTLDTNLIPINNINIHFQSGLGETVIKDLLKFANTFVKNNKNYLSTGYCKTRDSNKFDDNINYEINLYLYYGTTKIKYNYEDIYIIYKQDANVVGTADYVSKFETLTLSGNSLELLQNFMEASREYKIKINKNDRITIKILIKSMWMTNCSIPPRKIETIFPHFDINKLFNDITEFYDCEEDYIENGIPYKLNILFHGISGSGKTSIIYTIASKFNLDICFLPLGKDLNDNNFIQAISNIPNNNLLIIEDIDSLFINRDSKTQLSFSTFINVLDGMLKKNKLITFLTTNHKDILDKALFRAGRINYEYEFTYISDKQIIGIFNHFFKNQDEALQKILQINEYNRMSCSTIHNWCFMYRKKKNLNKYIDELKNLVGEEQENNSFMNMYN